jgi:lysophospholipase L1-like esterase
MRSVPPMSPTPSADDAAVSDPVAPHPRRRARVFGCTLAVTVALVVLAIELLSRRADAVVESRKADPTFDARAHDPDLWDKWSVSTLDPYSHALDEVRIEPHPFLGYALKPSWRSPPGAKLQVSHNSLGLRGKERAHPKPAGTFRIVTLGGSSVYGSQDSSDDSVWSERLERALATARPGTPIEVLNGGCLGYNSFEMLVQLELRVLPLSPDLVIVYEAINDMKAALYWRGGPVQDDNTHYRTAWRGERASPLDAFLARSRTYLVWRRYATDWVEQQGDLYANIQRNYAPKESWYCDGGRELAPSEVPQGGLDNYRRNLNSMISVADAAGVRVVLATQALIPRHMDGQECRETQLATFARIQEIERAVAKERGMPLCDCGPEIAAEVERMWEASAQDAEPEPKETSGHRWRRAADGKWRKDLFHNDVHPYDDGSELIARVIGEWLLASRLLPGS